VSATPVRVGAVLLAAGLSRRMGGTNKLLLELDGAPIVARCADALLASPVRPLVVVTGHQAEEVRAALAGRALRCVHNAAPEQGLAGSLRAGIAALADEVAGALVCLADMPWVRPAHIDALLDAFAASGERAICVPSFAGQRGNPVLWPARFFAEIRALTGDRGARALLEAHADEVCYVPMSDPGVTLDVDTPEAFGKVSA
jgi:molybdenum cofactor cytidylyltransferase